MVIRGTPKDVNHYIIIYDDKKIYDLSMLGVFPKYIDNDYAYFESNKIVLDYLNKIISNNYTIGGKIS